MEKDSDISFRPLSSGLGFHPFSDGLPYAPVSKTTTTTKAAAAAASALQIPLHLQGGTGATAAGPARFVNPPPRKPLRPNLPNNSPHSNVPRIQIPIAHSVLRGPISPAQPMGYTPAIPGYGNTHVRPRQPGAPQYQSPALPADAAQNLASQLGIHPHYGFLYVLKRILAYSLDTLLNVALSAGALCLALWNQNLNPDMLLNPAIILISGLFFGVFNWALVTAQEITFGTSFGKRIFRLALNGSTSAIFLRAFFFLPSLGFGGLGLLWALFDSRRRCWHDMVVDVQPLEIAQL